jgi:cysteinyl-tRNA synthetase
MAEQLLGPVFEIHGGGLDLVFPHHENELAQSLALGQEFAKVWMHNGMLRFVGEKMSKSLGNVLTMREAHDEWGRETLLVFFLSAHWRKPIDLSEDTLAQARAQVESFRNAFVGDAQDGAADEPEREWERLTAVLDDDFNTPDALALLHEWRAHGRLELLRRGLALFGLASLAEQDEAPSGLVELAQRRQDARAARDFAEADRLRAEIESAGWDVRDEAGGFRLVRRQ